MTSKFQKILFATDLSDLSWSAFPMARELAEKFAAEMVVFSVVEEPYYLSTLSMPGAYAQIMSEAQPRVVDQILMHLKKHEYDHRADIKVTQAASAAQEICTYAKEHGVDIVVLATHGRSGLQHLLLGSVAEKVVRSCPVPVLTVRADEEGASS